jgi:hypothetical protein
MLPANTDHASSSDRLLAQLEHFASRTRATPVATGLSMIQMVKLALPKIVAEAVTPERNVRQVAEEWLVDVCTVVEIADQRVEQDFDSTTVTLRVADWNRIVAVARGHVSKAAKRQIEQYRAEAFLKATTEAKGR